MNSLHSVDDLIGYIYDALVTNDKIKNTVIQLFLIPIKKIEIWIIGQISL